MELSQYKYLCFILSNHVIENDFCSSVKEVSALHRVYRLSDKWQLLYRTILSTHVFLHCCNITFVGLCELLFLWFYIYACVSNTYHIYGCTTCCH